MPRNCSAYFLRSGEDPPNPKMELYCNSAVRRQRHLRQRSNSALGTASDETSGKEGRLVFEAALTQVMNVRDVGPGTIHNDVRGLCASRSDGRDRRAACDARD